MIWERVDLGSMAVSTFPYIDVAAVVTFLLARIGATRNFSELIANPLSLLLVFCLDLSPPTAMAPVDLGRGKGKPGRRKEFFGWLK